MSNQTIPVGFTYVNIAACDNKYINLTNTEIRQQKPTVSTQICMSIYMYMFYSIKKSIKVTYSVSIMCKENMKRKLNICRPHSFILLNFTGIPVWRVHIISKRCPVSSFQRTTILHFLQQSAIPPDSTTGTNQDCMASWEASRCDTTWISYFSTLIQVPRLAILIQLCRHKNKYIANCRTGTLLTEVVWNAWILCYPWNILKLFRSECN